MSDFYSSSSFESAYTYSGHDLGAFWTAECTHFRVWAPTANAVTLIIYETGTPWEQDELGRFSMQSDVNGTWFYSLPGDRNGVYYTYLAKFPDHESECCDPYAVSTGVNGQRAMVLNMESVNPEGWNIDTNPNQNASSCDAVIYEAHIRDLTVGAGSGIRNKGKYLGLCESETHTRSGIPTGLSHMKNLGITHLHLLPVFDYGSVDEANLGKKQYNWGYDPVNFNVPEGSYSTDPFHGEIRVSEMKQMVSTLHKNGISVIMDVVYNHVYHHDDFCFNKLVPGYFTRGNSNGSGCGNDVATERSMVRKYIVDSVNFWADEYHIDGFRFDLVGLIDVKTINAVIDSVSARHPGTIFYGEGWEMATSVTKDQIPMAVQRNAYRMSAFAFFNDTIRDSLRGSVFHMDVNGFASGADGYRQQLENCFSGHPSWATSPAQSINYVSCHDNHTLYDRISLSLPNSGKDEWRRRSNLAAAFSILSQGIPFFQAGEEFLRSKVTRTGKILHNTYRSPDSVNALNWNRLNLAPCQETLQYYKGLLAFRKAFSGLRLTTAKEVSENLFPIPTHCATLMCFLLYCQDCRIYFAFNSGRQSEKLLLPRGTWDVYISGSKASEFPLGSIKDTIYVDAVTTVALVQKR